MITKLAAFHKNDCLLFGFCIVHTHAYACVLTGCERVNNLACDTHYIDCTMVFNMNGSTRHSLTLASCGESASLFTSREAYKYSNPTVYMSCSERWHRRGFEL